MRTIPRGQDNPIDPEIDVLVPMSDIKGEYPLVRELRIEMPKKVFGVSLKTGKRAQAVEWMLKALSSTDTPTVRSLLQEISRDSADQLWAVTAGKMLRNFDRAVEGTDSPKEESTATLSGDLKLFGLPNLLQNLADSQIAGVLKVFDSFGSTEAELWLDQGKVIGARSGRLAGEVAEYQLLEDPAPGRFVLDQLEIPPENSRTGQDPMSIQSILFEGIRRYDEFKRAASIAPDNAHFRSTGKQPTMGEDETDPEVFREVWRRAAAGMSPNETESEVLVDRYRVRVLFEHWIFAGSLESAEPDPDSESPTP